MILSIRFKNINQHDDVYLTVDKFSKKRVYSNEKWLNDNERLFVEIYDDGFVHYGCEVQKDPYHNNQKYVWSSNPSAINEEFRLTGTYYQLARWEIGARELEGKYSSYFSRGVLVDTLMPFVEANQDLLHYGYEKFYNDNVGKFTVIEPREGVLIGERIHTFSNKEGANTNYVDVTDNDVKGYMRIMDLHEYVMKRRHGFCLGELFNTTL